MIWDTIGQNTAEDDVPEDSDTYHIPLDQAFEKHRFNRVLPSVYKPEEKYCDEYEWRNCY